MLTKETFQGLLVERHHELLDILEKRSLTEREEQEQKSLYTILDAFEMNEWVPAGGVDEKLLHDRAKLKQKVIKIREYYERKSEPLNDYEKRVLGAADCYLSQKAEEKGH